MTPAIELHPTSSGGRIYRIPLELFPGLDGYAHLVYAGEIVALVDVGSGFGECDRQLEAGLAAISSQFGEKASWDDLTHVLITHGHIDHFGGLRFVQDRCRAAVGIHELDLAVLTQYEQRLAVTASRLRQYLHEAGVDEAGCERVMSLYLLNKHLFSSVPVDFTFEAAGMRVGALRLIHVPGHCPGQVVIQLDEVLLSADHILRDVSPHQAPERLTLHTGLAHYLRSLQETRPLSDVVRLTLGGHHAPIEDLAARIEAIESLHRDRLGQVLALLSEPMTIAEVAQALFPGSEGYHELLALEEAGAHVEYLSQRGYLKIEDPEAIGTDAPVRYRVFHGSTPPWPAAFAAPQEAGRNAESVSAARRSLGP